MATKPTSSSDSKQTIVDFDFVSGGLLFLSKYHKGTWSLVFFCYLYFTLNSACIPDEYKII